MSDSPKAGYLARFGPALIDAGYAIVPIKPGEKFPSFNGWQKVHPDRALLADWLANGVNFINADKEKRNLKVANAGVGILTKNTPGVDIDVSDAAMAKTLENYCSVNFGFAPVRMGRAPRRLMLFRAETAFPKIASQVYLNPDEVSEKFPEGSPQQIEVLGDGQQFVAFHVHPGTGKPYEWLDDDSPLITPAAELPLLTPEMARQICDEFERLAQEAGWKLKPRKGSQLVAHKIAEDDPFAMIGSNDKPDNYTFEQMREDVLLIPNDDEDYDTWANVGMSICHHCDGDEEGLDLWIEWSRQSSKHEDENCEKKWPSFIKDTIAAEAEGRSLITARYIIKLAKEFKAVVATEMFEDLRKRLRDAPDMEELKLTCNVIKVTAFDQPTREILIGDLKKSFKRITEQTLSMGAARSMVRFENAEARELPRWLQNWVYLSSEDKFHNTKSQISMSIQAFNNNFSRNMLTKKDVLEGRAFPETLPSHYALNVHQIPAAHRQMYMPGMDELFTVDGVAAINTYTDRNVPAMPDKISKKDRIHLERVKRHFVHLFAIERDRELFIDWLAYIIQNPGKRAKWAVLLQGVESDGKSFFSLMMGVLLGAENLVIVAPKTLEGEYNGWAEGHQMAFIEEVKLHGHNRYDVLNQIKPLITNMMVPIRRMRTDPYNAVNQTAYLLATNFRDALPLDDKDSRYFVLFSRFQTKKAIDEFNAANPEYFDELHAALEEAPGAIRKWFMERKFSPEFSAVKRAPASSAKRYMVDIGKAEEMVAIDEILENSGRTENDPARWDMTRQLLNSTDLADLMVGMDVEMPQTKTVKKLLSDAGFTYLGRFKIAEVPNPGPKRLWSQEPERFIVDGVVDSKRIRDWINLDL